MAVYNQFIINNFITHVLQTICQQGTNAVVAFRVIRVIYGFHDNLQSRVTPNSFASVDSLSFESFIGKDPKFGFRLLLLSGS